MERIVRKQNYARAFQCSDCPCTDDETGCPDWWRWIEKNDKGEQRIVEQCGRAAAQLFEAQRLTNTKFVVDNVVQTRNIIDAVGARIGKWLKKKDDNNNSDPLLPAVEFTPRLDRDIA